MKVVLVDVGPRQFALRLDVELLGEVEAPAELTRQAVGVVFERALLRGAVGRDVGLGLRDASDHVGEHAVVTVPEAVGGKRPDVHFGGTAREVGVTVGVAAGKTDAEVLVRHQRVDADLDRVEVVFNGTAREAAAVPACPGAGRAFSGTDVAHALPDVVREDAVEAERRGAVEREDVLHQGVRLRDGVALLVDDD